MPAWVADEVRAALPPGWRTDVLQAPADGRGDGGAPHPEAAAALPGAEVYFGYGMPPELLRAACPTLRWVHSAAAGVAGTLHAEMRASPVVLTNSAGIHAPAIADTVLASMLHFARGVDFAVRAQAERRWDPAPFFAAHSPVRELADATVGLVGFGGIGREVAQRARALGMRVLAIRRSNASAAPNGVQLLTGSAALEQLLPQSHYLVVAAPETAQTRGMLGAHELALLPSDAVLINVARGRVVDEHALATALRAGRLRGAALDVFAHEPLPAASPLWDLANLLLLPHVSGVSHRFWRREADLMLDNLRRYLAGEPLRNVVDKTAGY